MNNCSVCNKQHMNFLEVINTINARAGSGHLFQLCGVTGVKPFYTVNYSLRGGHELDVLDYLSEDWIVLDEFSEFAKNNILNNPAAFPEQYAALTREAQHKI